MFITPSFKKSLIVEQFQGNYLNMPRAWERTITVWYPRPFLCFINLSSVVTFPDTGLN